MTAQRKALEEFIDAVDVTGGVFENGKGYVAPVGDPDWIDLGEAYLSACHALKRLPKYGEDPR